MQPLKLDTKVKFLYLGKWQTGILHAVKTHEQSSGIVTQVSYLVLNKDGEQIEVPQEFVKAI